MATASGQMAAMGDRVSLTPKETVELYESKNTITIDIFFKKIFSELPAIMSQFIQEKSVFEKNYEAIEKRRFKREREMEEERRNMISLKYRTRSGGGNYSRGGGYNRSRGNFGTF